MPKTTFVNLPEEKKNRILASLKKEFSRVPLKDALVSNIIVDANIPRGSFYQYFIDIEDSYYYVVNEYAMEIKKYLLNDLLETKGDIIKSYCNLYVFILDMIDDEKNKKYFEKIFLNMNYEVQSMFTPNFNDGLNKILNHTDISKLNIKTKIGVGYIIDIIESVMLNNIIKSYKRTGSREKNIEIFKKELSMICDGIIKK